MRLSIGCCQLVGSLSALDLKILEPKLLGLLKISCRDPECDVVQESMGGCLVAAAAVDVLPQGRCWARMPQLGEWNSCCLC